MSDLRNVYDGNEPIKPKTEIYPKNVFEGQDIPSLNKETEITPLSPERKKEIINANYEEKQYQTSSEDDALSFVAELEERGLKKLPEGKELRPGFYSDWAGETENGDLVLGVDYFEERE